MFIREKLAGLLFLEPSIAETIQIIDDTLKKLPEIGPIKGTDLNMVAGLVGRQLANLGRLVTVEQQVSEEGEYDYDDEDPTNPDEIIISQDTGEVAPISYDF